MHYTDEDRRKMKDTAEKVSMELLETEVKYLEGLTLLATTFTEPLQKKQSDGNVMASWGMTTEQVTCMVSQIPSLVNFHKAFLADLKSGELSQIPGVIIKYAPFFRMYTSYMNGYEACLATLNTLRDSKKFMAFLSDVRLALKDKGGQDLMSYMIMPVQRVPRYVLLLKELKKNTLPSTPVFAVINQALSKIQATALHINEEKRKIENMSKVIEIQNRITIGFSLLQPNRFLIREGEISTTESKGFFGTMKSSPRILFLFNDMLLLTNPEHKYKDHLELAAINIAELGDKNFEVTTHDKNIIMTCKDKAEKDALITELQNCQREIKEIKNAQRMRVQQGKSNNKTMNVHEIIKQKASNRMATMSQQDAEALKRVVTEGQHPDVLASRMSNVSISQTIQKKQPTPPPLPPPHVSSSSSSSSSVAVSSSSSPPLPSDHPLPSQISETSSSSISPSSSASLSLPSSSPSESDAAAVAPGSSAPAVKTFVPRVMASRRKG